MKSSLTHLFEEAFPSLDINPGRTNCWVSKALRPPTDAIAHLQPISDAIDVVDRHEQTASLLERLKQEHPTGRKHHDQYDQRVQDCLTEACAFAWADAKGSGCPEFRTAIEGAPDIVVEGKCWIEAKAIHPSQADHAATKEMEARVVRGTAQPPSPSLLNKFDSALRDARKKFRRQSNGEYIVFFNLTGIDLSQSFKESDVVDMVEGWAAKQESADDSVRLVVCLRYAWNKPLWDNVKVS